jgi:putative dimethyl sulfoxide reductase chaperone
VSQDGVSVKGKGKPAVEGLAALLSARAFAYDVVKSAFAQEPSPAYLRLLVDGGILQVFPFADSETGIAQAVRRVEGYLGQPDVMSGEHCDRLRWDYTRMFIGPGTPCAPPWESIYRDAEHLHFSGETLAVRQAYGKYGLAPKGFGREPDDHLGLELEFMQKLSEMAKEKAGAGDEPGVVEGLTDQAAFLDAHLLRWVPAWSKDVVRGAETEFYRGMAQLLEAYLHFDRALLADVLAAMAGAPAER